MATGTIHKLMPNEIGVSRRNLLDTWYFVGGGSQLGANTFPINTNGLTTYASGRTTIDSWYNYDATSVSVQSGGVGFYGTDGSTQSVFQELSFKAGDAEGKKMTATVLGSAGGLYTGTMTVPAPPASGWYYWYFLNGTYFNLVLGINADGSMRFYIQPKTTAGFTLKAAKLEVGAYQTLAHLEGSTWVLNEIPKWNETAPALVFDTATVSIGNIAAGAYTSSTVDVNKRPGYDLLTLVPQFTNLGYPVAGTYLDGNPPDGKIRVVAGVRNSSASALSSVTATIRVVWKIAKP